MKIETTHHIAAPPEQVFAYATDLPRFAERVESIVRAEVLTEGPVGVGTRFRETRVVFKREATEEMEFVAFDAPNGYAVACDSCGTKYLSTFTFTPSGDGTDVHMSFEATPYKLSAKIMGFLMRGMLKHCAKSMVKDLDDLARAIEADAATAS